MTVDLEVERDPALATPGGYRYDPGEVAEVAAQYRLTDVDARRVLAMSHTVPPLQQAAELNYPDTFGGVWIDAINARVVLQFTRDAASSTEALTRAHPHRDHVEPATVARPLVALEAARSALSSSAGPLGSARIHGFGVDTRRNTLFVEASGSAENARAVVAGIVRTVPVEVRQAEQPEDYHHWGANVDNCPINWSKCNPLRGSAVFHVQGSGNTSNPQCTQGFFARSNASTHRRMLTAGHCGGTGVPTTYYHYNEIVGGVSIEDNCTRDCRVDAQAHAVDNGWQMGPYVMHNLSSFDESYPIDGVWRGGDLAYGTVLCTTGAESGLDNLLADTNCRKVNNGNYSTTVDGKNYYNLVRLDTPCGTSRDSGAPLYAGFTAYGLLKGGNSGGCHFSQIRNVEVALNLTVQEFQ